MVSKKFYRLLKRAVGEEVAADYKKAKNDTMKNEFSDTIKRIKSKSPNY